MTKKLTLVDLLAYRDSEPVVADVQAALADDPALAGQLQRAIELRQELKALPPEVPPPELWEQVQAAAALRFEPGVDLRQDARPLTSMTTPTSATEAEPQKWAKTHWFAAPQLRMATAASVFLVGLLASALWLRNVPDVGAGDVSARDVQLSLQSAADFETLVQRSRRLETAVQSQVVSADAVPSRPQQALMFRIADLDAELNSLQQETMHPDLKERLWRQRVELLETLMEIQRFQMRKQADF
jgi:hypothetical protein